MVSEPLWLIFIYSLRVSVWFSGFHCWVGFTFVVWPFIFQLLEFASNGRLRYHHPGHVEVVVGHWLLDCCIGYNQNWNIFFFSQNGLILSRKFLWIFMLVFFNIEQLLRAINQSINNQWTARNTSRLHVLIFLIT